MVGADVALRHQLGVDRIMWGADYPHHEGTYPHTLTALRVNFAGLPESEVRAMTSLNAAEVYGFDLDYLQAIADRSVPPDQVATPVPRERAARRLAVHDDRRRPRSALLTTRHRFRGRVTVGRSLRDWLPW